jgi:capsular exopolysaccharide synthesis family protein
MQEFASDRRTGEHRGSGREELRRGFIPPADTRPDFKEVLTVLRLHKWSIISLTAVALALALVISFRRIPQYVAQSSVLVAPIDVSGGDVPPLEPNLATEEEVASSVAIARLVATNLGLETDPRDLPENLSVSSPSGTEILEFEYEHADPGRAQSLAQAFAEAYLDYRRGSASEALAQSAQRLQQELDTLEEQEEALLEQLEEADEAELSNLESELDVVQSLILQRELERASFASPGNVGSIVEPASLPTEPSSPNHVVNGGFGLAAGLALGIGLAFVRDRLTGRLRDQGDVEAQLGAPVIGAIPRVSTARMATGRVASRSTAGEAYRVLRTNLLAAAAREEVKTVLVTSPSDREGKTTTTANLGIALAQAGKRVILVSADLRRPRLHEFFRVPQGPGLSEVLTGREALGNAVRTFDASVSPHVQNLRVLPSGAAVDNPAELLASGAMISVLEALEAEADLVVLDVSPLLPVTDAVALAPLVDGVLLVVGPKSTTSISLASSRKQIDNVGARFLGVVLNDLGRGMVQAYGY